ncbi:MAG TPA: hypothetical protein VEB86_07965, partial [Chryseosolibacter sp.]|nr:hypothetical protein [Chryseosolibacter sp.]
MKKLTLEHDVDVIGLTVQLFPEGIQQAFDSLRRILPEECNRTYFGIVRQDGHGRIEYKAAASVSGPLENLPDNLEPMNVKGGVYMAATIKDWRTKLDSIKPTFMRLFQEPGV